MEGRVRGWDIMKYIRYKQIKRLLPTECQKAKNEKWASVIKEITDNIKDPKKSWELVNRPRKPAKDLAIHVINSNGIKVYTDKEK